MKKYVIIIDKNTLHFSTDDFDKVLAKCEAMRKTHNTFWRGTKINDTRVHLEHEYYKTGNNAVSNDLNIEFPSGQGIRDLKKLSKGTVVNLTVHYNDSFKTLYETENNITKEKTIEFIQHKRTYKSGLVYRFRAIKVQD